MKKVLFVLALSAIGWAYADAPVNLDTVKASIVQYYEMGEYSYDMQQALNPAKAYMTERVKENASTLHPQRLALVLDIDDTSLSNYPGLKRAQFGGTPEDQQKWVEQGIDPVIPETYQLYQEALQDYVTVFFITGRDESLRAATIKNLKAAGYTTYAGLYMRPHGNTEEAGAYKRAIRAQIEQQQGFDIIENVGDQYSDLSGGYADTIYKLPNPMYFIP